MNAVTSAAVKLQDFADFDDLVPANGPAEAAEFQIEEHIAGSAAEQPQKSSVLRRDVPPSELGYIPLLDSYVPAVKEIIEHFALKYSPEDFWLHLNAKLLSGLYGDQLNSLNPYSIIEFLLVCKDNNLNPLKSEVTGYYDWNTCSIKTQILLDGYCRIYSSHPQTDGMEYICRGTQTVELTVTEYFKDRDGKRRSHSRLEKRELPRTVECRIYRKDRKYPTVGCADIEDIGTSAAWQQHPLQMMRNRAFTRAVRMAFNLEGASYSDVEEINAEMQQTLLLKQQLNEAGSKALQEKEAKLKAAAADNAAEFLRLKIAKAKTEQEINWIEREIQDKPELGMEQFQKLMEQCSARRTEIKSAASPKKPVVQVRSIDTKVSPVCLDIADLKNLQL